MFSDFISSAFRSVSKENNFPRALAKTLEPIRHVPGLKHMSMIPANSPLDLFDADKFSKAVSRNGPSSYLEGRSLLIDPYTKAHTLSAPNEATASVRRAGLYTVAGLMMANAVGFDPFGATSLVNKGLALGVHVGLGGFMYNLGGKGKMLGLGYLGLTALNTYRSGNNFGPM